MTRRALVRGVLFGLAVGSVLSLVMTTLDYLHNPAGIFHDGLGVRWGRVVETWFSWFVAAALLGSVVAVPLLLWMSRPRRDN